MQKILIVTALALLGTCSSARGLSGVQLGLMGGYASGLSGEAFVIAPNVAGPIGVKASVALTRPSDNIVDSADIGGGLGTFTSAKKTLGASESGSRTTLGLDGTYSLGEVLPGVSAVAYAGGRYGMFKATESYAISNSSTTYKMNSFGIGAGAMLSYALAGNISLVGDLGVDEYFNTTIGVSGSAKDSIGTGDKTYSTVRNRLAFPNTVFKARIGVKIDY
ncbi:hypothetical protein [Deinococcus sp.]|uniref:hypothetical protein n=1 Tax=Deinococcus sp. TaxID=47478 RepID=UPI0025BB2FF9|nr:hypothetical protein [Deinococcus sp.]